MRYKFLLMAIFTLLPFINFAQSNNWGLGLRFNSPKGITIKKYYGTKAIEVVVGRPSPWNFYNFNKSTNYNFNLLSQGYTFAGSDFEYRPWSLQVHYLIHKNINLIPGLSWYYGIGGQARTSSYYYNYSLDNGKDFSYIREKKVYVGVGADFIAGMEYTFKSIPFTLFYDFNYYVEAFNHPLYMKLRGGLGLRYNF